jgi:anti-sigma-K factor RskA
MKCEETREQLDSYALGALERKEARRLESHLKSCLECRAQARQSHEAAGLLALAVPLHRASASLRSRLLARVAPRAVEEPASARAMPRWGVRALAFASPALALVVVGVFAWAVVLQNQMNDLRGDNDLLATNLAAGERSIAEVRQELAAAVDSQQSMFGLLDEQRQLAAAVLDPQAQAVELTASPEYGSIRGRYVWSPEYGLSVFLASNLPVLPLDLTYQLWLVEGDQARPVGTFRPLSDGTARLVIDNPDLAAAPGEGLVVTVEPPGGSETQTGFSVLQGGVTQ